MRKAQLLALTAGLALSLSPPLGAADRCVPADFPSIQQALDASVAGDTVRVAPGDYAEALEFNGKNVTLISEGGPAITRLLAGYGTAVRIGPRGALIGFTVTPAPQGSGAGVEVAGDGTLIRSNVFVGLTQIGPIGAAVWGNGASPVIDGNVFRNQQDHGNSLNGTVAFVNYSAPRIINNLFIGSRGQAVSLVLPEGNAPQVINNTFWSNQVAIHYSRNVNAQAQVYRNNLIVGNGTGLEVSFGTEAGNAVWENNLVYGNNNNYVGILDSTGQQGNLSADPLLVDVTHGDFHLRPASPAVDAGNATGAPDHDFDGDPRPVDGHGGGVAQPDIGADEFVPRPPPAPEGLVARSGDGRMTLTWSPVVDVTGYRLKRSMAAGGPYDLLKSLADTQYVDTAVTNGTRYFYVVSAVNQRGDGANSTETSETAGNLPPSAADDSASTPEDTTLTIAVLANDFDPNQDALALVALTQPINGAVTIVANQVRFEPAANFNGTNTFTYTVSDGRGAGAVGQVTVVVTPVNDPPVANDQGRFTVAGDTQEAFVLQASDVDGDTLTFLIEAFPLDGQVRHFNPQTGQGVFVPAHGFVGTDVLRFRVSDGPASSRLAPFVFEVTAPQDLDRNGLPDDWEVTHDVGNARADRDWDGLTNGEEYEANTDPDDPNSTLRVLSITPTPQGCFTLVWQSVGGTRYRVFSSNAQPGGGFVKPAQPHVRSAAEEIDPGPLGVPGTMSFTDNFTFSGGPPTTGGRYYQVVVVR